MDISKILPILQIVFRVVLAGVLVFAGVLKIIDNSALFETVAYITWIPVWMKSWIVDLLPYVEILIAALLLIKWKPTVINTLVTIIFTGFLGFAIYGFATGLEGDCGCFGEFGDSSFGWPMIIRNGVFVAMAGFLFLQPSRRD